MLIDGKLRFWKGLGEFKNNELLVVVGRYKNGEVGRSEVLDVLLNIANVDDIKIRSSVKNIFSDCLKERRRVGKPKKIPTEEILVRRITGDSYQKISDDLGVSMSSVYRTIRDNKELEQKLRNEIFN